MWAFVGAVAAPVIGLAVALPAHYPYNFDTADHGNDPTYRGTDHTREYVPLVVYGKGARAGVPLGDRASLADIGQTIAENFGLKLSAGESFLGEVTNAS